MARLRSDDLRGYWTEPMAVFGGTAPTIAISDRCVRNLTFHGSRIWIPCAHRTFCHVRASGLQILPPDGYIEGTQQ